MESPDQATNDAPRAVAALPGPTQCARTGCETVIQRPRVLKRREDGTPLEVQQFCSSACRVAIYDQSHPRIAAPGVLEAQGQAGKAIKQRIRELLTDGHQRTTAQIAFDLRVSEATAARELRKLRLELGAPVQMARLRGPAKPAVYWLPVGA